MYQSAWGGSRTCRGRSVDAVARGVRGARRAVRAHERRRGGRGAARRRRRWPRGRLILKSATDGIARAPQLYDVAARGAIQDGDATASSHATIARAALARLSDDEATWPALRASSALGAGEAEVAATLAKLAAVSRAAHPRLCACLKTDAILRWLAGLAAFATKSKRSAYATDARNALKALVEDDGAAFVRAFLDGGKGAFASGGNGGVRFDVNKAPDDCVEGALIVLTDLAAPALAGAVFAALLEDFLRAQRDDAMPDLDKLRFVAALAEKLDGGTMEVSGSALLRTLKAVLDDASNALQRGEEDDDEAGLERVALGAVLGILELGAAKRADDEEAALKALLEPLEALSSPTRRASSFAQLAVDCRARVFYVEVWLPRRRPWRRKTRCSRPNGRSRTRIPRSAPTVLFR